MILGWKCTYNNHTASNEYSFQPLLSPYTFCNCCGATFFDEHSPPRENGRYFAGIAMYEGTGPDKLFPKSEKTVVETKNGSLCFLIKPSPVTRETP